MKILIDMCLSPEWVGYFEAKGIESQHWSDVGDPKASDYVIMDFARSHGMVCSPTILISEPFSR